MIKRWCEGEFCGRWEINLLFLAAPGSPYIGERKVGWGIHNSEEEKRNMFADK